ncbi:MAG: hypothetical protein ACI87C_001451 [Paraperlucidibaca sp.]|jgi:hypothetical protein
MVHLLGRISASVYNVTLGVSRKPLYALSSRHHALSLLNVAT